MIAEETLTYLRPEGAKNTTQILPRRIRLSSYQTQDAVRTMNQMNWATACILKNKPCNIRPLCSSSSGNKEISCLPRALVSNQHVSVAHLLSLWKWKGGIKERRNNTIYCYVYEWLQTGFGSEIGFTDHFNTWPVSTLNYSAIANLRTLQITTAHAKFFQSLRVVRRLSSVKWTRHVKIIGSWEIYIEYKLENFRARWDHFKELDVDGRITRVLRWILNEQNRILLRIMSCDGLLWMWHSTFEFHKRRENFCLAE
jgi:hypothetical protein